VCRSLLLYIPKISLALFFLTNGHSRNIVGQDQEFWVIDALNGTLRNISPDIIINFSYGRCSRMRNNEWYVWGMYCVGEHWIEVSLYLKILGIVCPVCVTFGNPMYSLVTHSSAIYLLWCDVLGVFTTCRAPVKKSCVFLFIDMNNLRTGNMILTRLRIGGLHKKFWITAILIYIR
jgi:hypothetical protein